ncbi:MAG TPA: hypothetical protein VNV39_22805 [Stellaceae bacterium]|jgi:hypothetical protein|nr:hypothetical protein [Stellaceae bacterium]
MGVNLFEGGFKRDPVADLISSAAERRADAGALWTPPGLPFGIQIVSSPEQWISAHISASRRAMPSLFSDR